MAVPAYWRVDYTSQTRYFGKIKKVNCNVSAHAFFLLELVNTLGTHYVMQYNNLLLYTDQDHPDFKKYVLPSYPPLDSKHKPSVIA